MNTKSESLIAGLVPEIQQKAKDLLSAATPAIQSMATALGVPNTWTVEIAEGKRNLEYQAGLFSIGRVFDRAAKSWRIVNKAATVTDTLESKHLLGKAFDIAMFDPATGLYHWPDNDPLWLTIAEIGKKLGLIEGAYWMKVKPDWSHYELA